MNVATPTSNIPIAVGVDGCKSGWIAAFALRRPSESQATALKHFVNIHELVAWRNQLDNDIFVTVDVPIGLPETTRFRSCDKEARRRLRERQTAVFMPPGRYLIDATDHTEASRLVEERRHEKPDTKGISAQAWGIVPKIREVDEFIRANPQCLEWLFEVHPEVCFLEWFGHLPSKRKSAVGQIERLALVRRGFPDAERAILEDLNVTDGVDLTDVLDAYASLWTALRLTEEEHETLASETPDGITAKMIV